MAVADMSGISRTWGNIHMGKLTSGEGDWIEYT
jgi:hypothetical protein